MHGLASLQPAISGTAIGAAFVSLVEDITLQEQPSCLRMGSHTLEEGQSVADSVGSMGSQRGRR